MEKISNFTEHDVLNRQRLIVAEKIKLIRRLIRKSNFNDLSQSYYDGKLQSYKEMLRIIQFWKKAI
ncbi:MAG: hypothetical protein WC934_13325 [Acidithiobacillus sp.]|jgi:hypothetical protein|uniref:hypothetical protein n=1 Tax=Acidithiobacillus sp. TaxID=1872118 RepID=UPI003560C062